MTNKEWEQLRTRIENIAANAKEIGTTESEFDSELETVISTLNFFAVESKAMLMQHADQEIEANFEKHTENPKIGSNRVSRKKEKGGYLK